MHRTFWGIGIGNHGRPWACEREGPVLKKMSWKVAVYSCLSGRLIGYGRDSAKRVVSDTDTPKSSPKECINQNGKSSFSFDGAKGSGAAAAGAA